ncbi:hypothetical protein AM499_06015 [Bacillus sp. FJAT-22090]|uniref:PepSY domain-containing protein n=1 Tax=Bacillus sp. FJAT-22090 TaxID=1581038 RepID=UPI0006B02B20|nr:PepSY domain-containing protein [Bacillus sp. FJAT-22090]ALC85420.1 hypothetical protein AM499_06015 [Bacillus sp. FJAT-22090]
MLNPPVEWKNSISFDGLEELPPENISVQLIQRQGFWNELTNRMQWEVTIKYTGKESTVVIDAYNGEFMDLLGPLN